MARSESAPEEPQDCPDAPHDRRRCTAIAVATGERCRHPAVPGAEYCAQHVDWNEYETG